MSFIKESKNAYRKVQENHIAIAMGKMLDDEGSMILNQLEELERAIKMVRTYVGTDYEKQLPAWVQSKVTLATDYISTVGNYLSSKNEKVTEEIIKEEVDLTETTFEKIYQMQQDGKSSEEIAKELKLNSSLVKKVLGEELLEEDNAKYPPHILELIKKAKAKEAELRAEIQRKKDLEKNKTKVTEEIELKEFTDAEIAQLKKEFDPLKNKQLSTARANQLSNILDKLDDGSLDKLKSALIPFVSALAAAKTTQRKMRGVKITNIKVPGLEGMAEENTFWWHDGKTGYMKAGYDNKELLAWLKKNGYKPEKDIKTEETLPVMSGSDSLGYNVKYKVKKSDQMISVFWSKEKNLAQKFLDDIKKTGGNGIITAKEETELQESTDINFKPAISINDLKKYGTFSGQYFILTGTRQKMFVYKTGDKITTLKITAGNRTDDKDSDKADMLINKIAKDMKYKNKNTGEADYHFTKEEVELKPVPSLEDSAKKHNIDIEALKKQLEKGIKAESEHTDDPKVAEKIALAHLDERPDYYDQLDKLENKPVEKITEVKEPTGELKDACWTGYVAVGTKMKNGKRVPNCVPKSEAYKGAKSIVEKAWKKLKEKK